MVIILNFFRNNVKNHWLHPYSKTSIMIKVYQQINNNFEYV